MTDYQALSARMEPYCQKLAAPNIPGAALSIAILAGVIASYLPQHYRLISRKTTVGISPYFLLLGTVSSIAGFANILLLPRSQRDVSCCKDISAFACFASLLGILQVGSGFLCFALIMALYMIYVPRQSPMVGGHSRPQRSEFHVAITVATLCLLFFLTTIAMSIMVELRFPDSLQLLANCFGIMAAILASIQYFPQIYTTFQLRCVGSLSVPMMCVQTPGSFVWAANLAARVGWEGWSTWGVYIVTATLQGVLLMMGIYFEYIDPSKSGADSPSPASLTPEAAGQAGGGEPDENTPLLSGQDISRAEPSP